MHMSYWFGTDIGDFLIKGFTISSAPGFISICFGLLSLAILFEAVNLGLMSTRQETVVANALSNSRQSEASLLLTATRNTARCRPNSRFQSMMYQVVFFMSRDVLSYTLMLAVMTYNGYFTISVALGAGIGFFIFSPLLMEIGRRNNSAKRSHITCTQCVAKMKQDEARGDTDSLSEAAYGVSELAASTVVDTSINRDVDRSESPVVAVVEIHATAANIEVPKA